MFKKAVAIMMLTGIIFYNVGCYTHSHVVGSGAKSGVSVEEKQWYVLWGLVPLNSVDTNAMAGDATDYTIQTQHSFIDIIIGMFTGIVTVSPKTVKVTK
jgi:hypothetical protein